MKDAWAGTMYGMCIARGIGVEKDTDKALEVFSNTLTLTDPGDPAYKAAVHWIERLGEIQ